MATVKAVKNATGEQFVANDDILQVGAGITANTGSLTITGAAPSDAITIGTSSTTGTTTLGLSTDTNTISIGSANPAAAKTQTIRIGDASSGQTDVVVGSTGGTSSTTINAGTGNIDIGIYDFERSIRIGTGSGAKQSIYIGTTYGASLLHLKGGTGGVEIFTHDGTTTGRVKFSSGSPAGGDVTMQCTTGQLRIKSNTDKQLVLDTPGTASTCELVVGGSNANLQLNAREGGTVYINSAGTNTVVDVRSGTSEIVIGNGTGTIRIGDMSSARTVKVGTGNEGAAQTVIVGSNYSGSSLTLRAGTGALKVGDSTATNSIEIGDANMASDGTQEIFIASGRTGTYSATPAYKIYIGEDDGNTGSSTNRRHISIGKYGGGYLNIWLDADEIFVGATNTSGQSVRICGGGTSSKLSFFNHAANAQQSVPDDTLGNLLTALRAYGLIA